MHAGTSINKYAPGSNSEGALKLKVNPTISPKVWSAESMVCGNYGLRKVLFMDSMVRRMYGTRTVWFAESMVRGQYGPQKVWYAESMVQGKYGPQKVWFADSMVHVRKVHGKYGTRNVPMVCGQYGTWKVAVP